MLARAPKKRAAQAGAPLSAVVDRMRAPDLGFARVEQIVGDTYGDSSTVLVVVTRGTYKAVDPATGKEATVEGLIDKRVVMAWQTLAAPMNQKRAIVFTSGHEVGRAYNTTIKEILASDTFKGWRYVLTLEDDNIPPPDAHLRLLETIEWGKYDAVSGLYFTKGAASVPMAFGDPAEYRETGVLEFRPRDVRDALKDGPILPVNGIGMGCALWRLEMFRELAAPWFVTVSEFVAEKGLVAMTQDLSFCERAVAGGKRFAVDTRVRVGHLDVASGVVF